jgi:hypothetical protein
VVVGDVTKEYLLMVVLFDDGAGSPVVSLSIVLYIRGLEAPAVVV